MKDPPAEQGAGIVAALALALAVCIGIQLGGIPWRYRQQLWLMQGAAVGTLVGYLVGRFSTGRG